MVRDNFGKVKNLQKLQAKRDFDPDRPVTDLCGFAELVGLLYSYWMLCYCKESHVEIACMVLYRLFFGSKGPKYKYSILVILWQL